MNHIVLFIKDAYSVNDTVQIDELRNLTSAIQFEASMQVLDELRNLTSAIQFEASMQVQCRRC